MVDALEEKIGENIVLLDIHEIASFTDYFVLCSGTSDRMVDSLAQAAAETGDQLTGLKPKVEGHPSSGWVLVDMGDIVVHLFSPDQRDYYQLEQLWERGKILLRLQ
jgi:ribosome-associated protein